MTNERRELILRLAVASYDFAVARNNYPAEYWANGVIRDADVLLAALNKESPPTHAAADHPASAPSQEGAGLATAAPGGEPVLPCAVKVGCVTFHRGVLVSTLQKKLDHDYAPGGEPKEWVCRWTATNHTVGSGIYERRVYITGCEDKRHESRESGAVFCKYCGGKIITEAT